MLPTSRSTNRMTGIESPGWRLFTDGGLNAKSTAQRWQAGELLPSRLTTLSKTFVVLFL